MNDLMIYCTKSEMIEMLKSVVTELNPIKPEKTEEGAKYDTRKEVCAALKISLPTLNRLSKNGTLRAYRIGGRVLYRKDEINQALTAIPNIKYKRV